MPTDGVANPRIKTAFSLSICMTNHPWYCHAIRGRFLVLRDAWKLIPLPATNPPGVPLADGRTARLPDVWRGGLPLMRRRVWIAVNRFCPRCPGDRCFDPR